MEFIALSSFFNVCGRVWVFSEGRESGEALRISQNNHHTERPNEICVSQYLMPPEVKLSRSIILFLDSVLLNQGFTTYALLKYRDQLNYSSEPLVKFNHSFNTNRKYGMYVKMSITAFNRLFLRHYEFFIAKIVYETFV